MRCFEPIDVFCKSTGHSYNVPCGRCPACRKRKQSEWVLRMDFERKYGERKRCYFVTLTYAPEFIHSAEYVNTDTGEVKSEYVLSKEDATNFLKRYRRYSSDICRFFLCGEYGDKFDRPHMHLVLYTNNDWRTTLNNVRRAWSVSVPNSTPLGSGVIEFTDKKYVVRRQLLGLVTVSSVNLRRMRYCAKYIVKDTNSSLLVPKFARVSRGLGKCFLNDPRRYAQAKKSLNPIFYTDDNKPTALPRYLRNRIFNATELEQIQLRYIRRIKEPPLSWSYEKRQKFHQQIFRDEENRKRQVMLSRISLF